MDTNHSSTPYERAKKALKSLAEEVGGESYYKNQLHIAMKCETDEDLRLEKHYSACIRDLPYKVYKDCVTLAELTKSLAPNEKQELIAIISELIMKE